MSGNIQDFAAWTRSMNPLALYIHCCSHVLNLVIMKSCSLSQRGTCSELSRKLRLYSVNLPTSMQLRVWCCMIARNVCCMCYTNTCHSTVSCPQSRLSLNDNKQLIKSSLATTTGKVILLHDLTNLMAHSKQPLS